jgi:hypothetical protein
MQRIEMSTIVYAKLKTMCQVMVAPARSQRVPRPVRPRAQLLVPQLGPQAAQSWGVPELELQSAAPEVRREARRAAFFMGYPEKMSQHRSRKTSSIVVCVKRVTRRSVGSSCEYSYTSHPPVPI